MPWCAFHLAQVSLYTGHSENFVQYVDAGIDACPHKWQPGTFRETLELLTAAGIDLPCLQDSIGLLKVTDGLAD